MTTSGHPIGFVPRILRCALLALMIVGIEMVPDPRLAAQAVTWNWANNFGGGDTHGRLVADARRPTLVFASDFGWRFSFGRDFLTIAKPPLFGIRSVLLESATNDGVIRWTHVIGDSGVCSYAAHAIDAAGNIYLAIHCNASSVIRIGSTDTVHPASSNEFELMKFDSAGTFRWSRTIGLETADIPASRIVCDSVGGVYFSGSMTGYLTVGKQEFGYGPNTSTFIVKFDSLGAFVGGTTVFGLRVAGGSESSVTAVGPEALPNGGVVFAGQSSSTEYISVQHSDGSTSRFVADALFMGMFDASLHPRWLTTFKCAAAIAEGLTLDRSGNITFSAAFTDNLQIGSYTMRPVVAKSLNVALIRMTSSGELLWARWLRSRGQYAPNPSLVTGERNELYTFILGPDSVFVDNAYFHTDSVSSATTQCVVIGQNGQIEKAFSIDKATINSSDLQLLPSRDSLRFIVSGDFWQPLRFGPYFLAGHVDSDTIPPYSHATRDCYFASWTMPADTLPRRSIGGRVRDEHDGPIAHATVSDGLAYGSSDENGFFQLRGLSSGVHTLHATQVGFQADPPFADVTVRDTDVTTILPMRAITTNPAPRWQWVVRDPKAEFSQPPNQQQYYFGDIVLDSHHNIITSYDFDSALILKSDSLGQPLWKTLIPADSGKVGVVGPWKIGSDKGDSIYAYGSFYGDVLLGPDSLHRTDQLPFYLAKLDPEGRIVWARAVPSSSAHHGNGLTVSPFDHADTGFLFCGFYQNSSFTLGGTTLLAHPTPFWPSWFVARYDRDARPVQLFDPFANMQPPDEQIDLFGVCEDRNHNLYFLLSGSTDTIRFGAHEVIAPANSFVLLETDPAGQCIGAEAVRFGVGFAQPRHFVLSTDGAPTILWKYSGAYCMIDGVLQPSSSAQDMSTMLLTTFDSALDLVQSRTIVLQGVMNIDGLYATPDSGFAVFGPIGSGPTQFEGFRFVSDTEGTPLWKLDRDLIPQWLKPCPMFATDLTWDEAGNYYPLGAIFSYIKNVHGMMFDSIATFDAGPQSAYFGRIGAPMANNSDVRQPAVQAETRVTISVFPDPAGTSITATANLPADGIYQFTVSDLLGRRVASSNVEWMTSGARSQTITLPSLAAGTYVLTLVGNGVTASKTVRIR